ncbi:MAG TPA: hypothetical protein VGS20_14810 [Candidatus Acidoferrales bacterium]|nr:hypothetical protein [Candidatus Acidoferrales bacterium]
MKITRSLTLVLQELNSTGVKQSEGFLLRKRQHLARYKDVQDLGIELADGVPLELRGVEHHFVLVRAKLLKAFAAKEIFIGTGVLDELILSAIQDPRTKDLFRSVVMSIMRYGIHKPGILVVPIHSFGIAGFGFYRHFTKSAATVKFPELGLVLTHQTNDLKSTLDFLDSARRILRVSGRVPHDSIRHYFRSRSTSWLERNPMLVLRIRGASASNYDNQRFFVYRLQIATSLVFLLVALTSDFDDGTDSHFGSTSRLNNSETLDIKHYLLLETSGKTRGTLRGACVPIHVDAAIFAELVNLNVDLNLRRLQKRQGMVSTALTVLGQLETLYFAHLFDNATPSPRLIVHRKIFDSLAYFRRSFRVAANPGEPIVNLAIAFEMLLTDNYAKGVKARVVRRVGIALKGLPRSRSMRDEVARLFEARGEVVHQGKHTTQTDLIVARKAYALSLIRLAKLSIKHERLLKTCEPIGEVLADL